MNTEGVTNSDVSQNYSGDQFTAEHEPLSLLCGELTLSELLEANRRSTCGSRASFTSSRRVGSAIKDGETLERFTEPLDHSDAWDFKPREYQKEPGGEAVSMCSQDKSVSTGVTSMATESLGFVDEMKTGVECRAENTCLKFHVQENGAGSSKKLPLLNDTNIRKDLKDARPKPRARQSDASLLPVCEEEESVHYSQSRSVCVSGRGYTKLSQEFSPLRPFLPHLTLSQCGDVDSAVIEVVRDHNDPNRGVARSIDSPFTY